MQRWKPSGAPLNARPWKEANNGPRIRFDGSYSNSSKRLITGAGSTALWGINHLWTSNKTTTKNAKDRVKYCDHKKGGREHSQANSLRKYPRFKYPKWWRDELWESDMAKNGRVYDVSGKPVDPGVGWQVG